jgi:hypothetical protein
LPGGIILQGVLLAFTLAWRNYSPRSITPPTCPRFYERFCVPLQLGANCGYWPSDSVFGQGGASPSQEEEEEWEEWTDKIFNFV